MDSDEPCSTPSCEKDAKIFCNKHRIGICLTCDCCYHHRCQNHPLLSDSQLSENLKFYSRLIRRLQLNAGDPLISQFHPNLSEEVEELVEGFRRCEEKMGEIERTKDRGAIADLDTEIKRNLSIMAEKEICNQTNHLLMSKDVQDPNSSHNLREIQEIRNIPHLPLRQINEPNHEREKQKLTKKLKEKRKKIYELEQKNRALSFSNQEYQEVLKRDIRSWMMN